MQRVEREGRGWRLWGIVAIVCAWIGCDATSTPVVSSSPDGPDERRNVIFVLVDDQRYDAVVAVRLEIFDINGRRVGVAEAQARRSRSVPENITLNDRDKVWFSMTESLTNDLNGELERSIPQFLGAYLR